ncbi:MAG: ATP-binding protein [Methanophagales archaeon]|nr:ATP-binding protein [Methanophagales archaeon]
MEKDAEVPMEGTIRIKVSKEVVSHLSLGLYRNFARAVKELISNAYDAGATEVKIKLDLDNNRIIVRDNGRGMDIKEIEEKFLTIGYPTPLIEDVDELGRKRIGTFGIGCLSVFPYCNRLQIITKKRNKDEIIEIKIDTKRFFKKEAFFFVEETEVPYKIHPSDLSEEIGETIIVLEEIKSHIAEELQQKESHGKSSIDKFSGFQKFKWALSQYAPIQFPPDRKDLRDFFDNSGVVPMRLWLDGDELFRNIPENAGILEKGEEQFGDVSLRYAIMTTMRPIEPEEARGIQIRLRNVAIGLPMDFDVTKLTSRVLGKLNYICGEVHILRGLNSALMIDRDSFSYTQDVANIDEFFRKKLNEWNNTLEKWASEDKETYKSLMNVKGSERVIDELRKANIIRFAKERLRLSEAPIIERKGKEVLSLPERVIKALSKIKDYKVCSEKGKISAKESPIKVFPMDRSIVVYEQHPDFEETIEVGERGFKVEYDKWDFDKTHYSICRLFEDRNVVVFNTSHPLFKSKLSDEIIKRLSLEMVLILKDKKDNAELLTQLNHLLERIFLR